MAGAGAENTEEHCLPACSAWFLNTTQDQLPRVRTAHSELKPLHINQESGKSPTDTLPGQLMETILQLRISLDSSLCQAAKN